METKRQADQTKPMDNFGTAPNIAPALKQTNYSGTMLKDRYLIEGELGRGGIGVVYLARDTQLLQRRVVIKVLLESSEQSLHTPWFRKKFDQEIEALVRIDHPGVVGVLDAGAMPDGKPFFVMQYVEGTNLRTLMQHEMQTDKLDLARIAHIVRQIGQALTAAHDKGIIHRDLKPENVMVTRPTEGEEVLKLIDFGIATVKDSQSSKTDSGKTKVAGALPYMAPEQLRGEPQAASDQWSLGVMAYELLTGHLPFNAETLVQLHEQQRQGAQPLPRELRHDLPPAAEQAVLKAMAFAAEERFGRARDFGDTLAEALLDNIPRTMQTNSMGQQPTTASAPTILGSGSLPDLAVPRPAEGKSPLPYFALAVLLLAAVVGVVSYIKLRKPDPPQNGGTTVAPAAPERELSYSLTARLKKMADGKPIELAGEVVFSPGDEVRFKLSSPQDGFLYIIGEAPQPDPKTGLPLYNLIFPKQATPPATMLNANQTIYLPSDTGAGYFVDKEVGSEKLWLVWAKQSVAQLEQLRKWYNPQDKGAINGADDTGKLRDFLQTHYNAAKPVAEKGEKQMQVKGGKDGLLVYPIRLEHY